MPTAAKLIAALSLAVVAFFATTEIVRTLPDGMAGPRFVIVNCAIGFLVGWKVLGRYADRGYRGSIPFGFWALSNLVFWAMVTHSINEMLSESTKLRYDGVMEALQGTFEIMLEYAIVMIEAPASIVTLLIGSLLATWASVWADKRWK
ncbi:TrgA family protein [Actibacterium pelagium]|uniref:Tellurium resistance protein n=1 Tax=Actibacterium pelagium TaxID=2029103 RepID=A0A917AET6_9RHOB|nr:TrgA family protein [Actibacterium pelagium]GGE43342.1 hypothetical protein GCM10011517_08730 [Actibacterium pelagium]